MSSDKLDPDDSGPVLHFDHQALFVASDVEHHPAVGANFGATVLVFNGLRRLPICPCRFEVPILLRLC